MFNKLHILKWKEIKKWLQDVLNLALSKRNSKSLSIPLIALTIFWIVEVVFLFTPDKYERLISIVVVLQYLLVFYAAYKTTSVDKVLFYPFIPYYLYTLGALIAGYYMDISHPKLMDYIVFVICMSMYFLIAIKRIK